MTATERTPSGHAGEPPPRPTRALVFGPPVILLAGAILALVLSGSAAVQTTTPDWPTLTPASRQMFEVLRDPSTFRWYVIFFFALVIYVYTVEVERKNWSCIMAGAAFFGMDWFNEIWNGLVLHLTQYSAVWTTPGHSAYVIFAGWTIEIAFMFSIAGVVFTKSLPPDPKAKLFGLPNRWALAAGWSVFCVLVEVLLNKADALIWDWSWWNWPNLWLIILFGYLHFYVVSFLVFDMKSLRNQILVVSYIFAIDAAATLVFSAGLRWI